MLTLTSVIRDAWKPRHLNGYALRVRRYGGEVFVALVVPETNEVVEARRIPEHDRVNVTLAKVNMALVEMLESHDAR